jgi:alpha-D-ribose 1-methylphosphonate 5-triphosphate synthase subunit PhnH
MARPGTVHALPLRAGETPDLAVLAALADHEVTFALLSDDVARRALFPGLARSVTVQSGAVQATVPEADFVVSFGPLPAFARPQLRRGVPAFPDRSATLIYVVQAVGLPGPESGAVEITLRGPGVETEQRLTVSGLPAAELAGLAEINADFPLGVDTIFVDGAGRLACIPRSSTITVAVCPEARA